MKRWQIAVVVILILAALFLADGGTVYLKELLSTSQPGMTDTQSITSTSVANHPPKAAFMYRMPTRTLKYIAPTDQDLILFLNNSTDPDTPIEALDSRWYIQYNGTGDWQFLDVSRDYSATLPAGQHMIKLVVSDGRSQDSTTRTIVVDKTDIYSSKQLTINLKGIKYHVGRRYMGEYGRYPDPDEISESLEVIRFELGCNAVILWGDNPDVMVFAAEKAIEKGYQVIILSPRYRYTAPDVEVTIDEFMNAVIEFSKKAEELRNIHDGIVLSVGEELQYSTRGLVNASTYDERIRLFENMTSEERAAVHDKLNIYLAKVVEGVRENFHGRLTYLSNHWSASAIEWRELGLDIVGPMGYFAGWTETGAVDDLLKFKTYGKPVYVAEFGFQCCVGATAWAGEDGCDMEVLRLGVESEL